MNIRTRYAPSPTGYQHVGNIRTALFAWLVARQSGGSFIVRLEDTDRSRYVEGAEAHLLECIKTLGLNHDEGFDIGGKFAPYRQSERLDTYKKWAQKLIDKGRAYADPYSSEQVQQFREQSQAAKQPFLYRNHRPDNPPEWDGTMPLRFKSEPQNYSWQDEVMGTINTGPEVIDDFILIKSDGYPTYNFAHIVDDAEMQISHIIRGQEFISSTPNYLNLYDALSISPPTIATMPHILNEQGNKKLGKRDGAKDVLEYIREGYLPEALVSFIATLGWNDGSTQEVFTVKELIEKFSLKRVGKSGAKFDNKRLDWVNSQFIRKLNMDDLMLACQDFWPEEAANSSDEYKKSVLALIQDRIRRFDELPELTRFFFVDLPVDPTLISGNKQLKQLSNVELINLLSTSLETLQTSDFSVDDLQGKLNKLLEQTGQKPAVLFSLIRIATTQSPSSPGLAESLSVLGAPTVVRRITGQINSLK
jgi:glutamyl-tRNA synthetase